MKKWGCLLLAQAISIVGLLVMFAAMMPNQAGAQDALVAAWGDLLETTAASVSDGSSVASATEEQR